MLLEISITRNYYMEFFLKKDVSFGHMLEVPPCVTEEWSFNCIALAAILNSSHLFYDHPCPLQLGMLISHNFFCRMDGANNSSIDLQATSWKVLLKMSVWIYKSA